MNGIPKSPKPILGFFLVISMLIGCGEKKKSQIEKKKEETTHVKLPEGDADKNTKTIFTVNKNERIKASEIIGFDGVVRMPFIAEKLAGKDKELYKQVKLIVHIKRKLPDGKFSVANGGFLSLVSDLGDDRYRYQGELKAPRNAGNYWVDIVYDAKTVASKKIVVSK